MVLVESCFEIDVVSVYPNTEIDCPNNKTNRSIWTYLFILNL